MIICIFCNYSKILHVERRSSAYMGNTTGWRKTSMCLGLVHVV